MSKLAWESLGLSAEDTAYYQSKPENLNEVLRAKLEGFKVAESIYKKFLSTGFQFDINMNDTFHYACADVCEMEVEDIEDMLPYFVHKGFDALMAYEAIKRGYDPTIKDYVTPTFLAVKDELLGKLMDDESFLPSLGFDFRQKLKQIEEFGGVLKFKFEQASFWERHVKRQRHMNCFCWVTDKPSVRGKGANMDQARKDLKRLLGV